MTQEIFERVLAPVVSGRNEHMNKRRDRKWSEHPGSTGLLGGGAITPSSNQVREAIMTIKIRFKTIERQGGSSR